MRNHYNLSFFPLSISLTTLNFVIIARMLTDLVCFILVFQHRYSHGLIALNNVYSINVIYLIYKNKVSSMQTRNREMEEDERRREERGTRGKRKNYLAGNFLRMDV